MIPDQELVRRWAFIAGHIFSWELDSVDPEPGRRIAVAAGAPRAGSEDTVESLRAEVDRLHGLLQGDPEVLKMHYESGHMEMVLGTHWASRLMAMSFGDSLRKSGAKNFISFEMRGLGPDGEDNGDPLRVTVRRFRGDDPEAVAHRLRQALEEIVDAWAVRVGEGLATEMANIARAALEAK